MLIPLTFSYIYWFLHFCYIPTYCLSFIINFSAKLNKKIYNINVGDRKSYYSIVNGNELTKYWFKYRKNVLVLKMTKKKKYNII